MDEEKTHRVAAIKDGTVIDHIPPKSTFKIVDILELGDESITIGNNLASKKMGLKGLIKIAGKKLTKQELNKIALIAPEATVCVIKNYKVVDKFEVEMPEDIVGIVRCFNPKCITRNQEVTSKFHLIDTNPLKLQCHHCERIVTSDDIVLL